MYLFKVHKKRIIILVSIILILLLISPIIINLFLLSWTTPYTFGKTDSWLNYFGTMISSIVGGIISGGLTFVGVLLTLQHQEKREFMKSYSSVRAKLDEILKDVVTVKRYLNDDFTEDHAAVGLMEKLQNQLSNVPNIMVMSTDISYHLYSEVKFKYVMNLELLYNHCKFHLSFGSKNLSSTVKDTENELSELILEITNEQKNLSEEYKKYNR